MFRGKDAVVSNVSVTVARSSLVSERERQGGGIRVAVYRGGISVSVQVLSGYQSIVPSNLHVKSTPNFCQESVFKERDMTYGAGFSEGLGSASSLVSVLAQGPHLRQRMKKKLC